MSILGDIRYGLHLRAERIRCEVHAHQAQTWIDVGAPDDRYSDHLGADRLAWADFLDALAGQEWRA